MHSHPQKRLQCVLMQQLKKCCYLLTNPQPDLVHMAQVRYDGVYRILRCWRKPGMQEHLVCRYLFVRCDNGPAPWSADGELETLIRAQCHNDDS